MSAKPMKVHCGGDALPQIMTILLYFVTHAITCVLVVKFSARRTTLASLLTIDLLITHNTVVHLVDLSFLVKCLKFTNVPSAKITYYAMTVSKASNIVDMPTLLKRPLLEDCDCDLCIE